MPMMKAGRETSKTERYAPESSTMAHPLVSPPDTRYSAIPQRVYNGKLQQFFCNICAEIQSRVPDRLRRAVSHPSTVNCG
jgi:hypothetical protein